MELEKRTKNEVEKLVNELTLKEALSKGKTLLKKKRFSEAKVFFAAILKVIPVTLLQGKV